MGVDFLALARPGVQHLQPYQPGKPVETLERELGIRDSIKLASNENPLGPSPKVVAALGDLLAGVNYYPDGGGYVLSQRLAEANGVEAACVTLGNGSNDVLELIARAYLGPDDSAVYAEHAFAVYPIVVQAVGARANVAPAYSESMDMPQSMPQSMPLGHDPEALLDAIDAQTRVMFIANPNNPTGTWLDNDTLLALFERIREDIIIVLDLAYVEYMDAALQPDIPAWLARFPNLVITRTFSKVHALAGLRIGYALSNPVIADVLNRVRQPFNTNLLAQAAALAALDDADHVARSVAINTAGKARLQQAFDDMGLKHLPTMGNFIAVKVAQNGADVYQRLLEQGVIVRPVANYAMPDYLRVTIGAAGQNERFLVALRQALEL